MPLIARLANRTQKTGVPDASRSTATLNKMALQVGALAEHLAMDRATLRHNLRHLQKAGWVALGTVADRRPRVLTLTEAGAALLTDTAPL